LSLSEYLRIYGERVAHHKVTSTPRKLKI